MNACSSDWNVEVPLDAGIIGGAVMGCCKGGARPLFQHVGAPQSNHHNLAEGCEKVACPAALHHQCLVCNV